jgi:hypothetical protein
MRHTNHSHHQHGADGFLFHKIWHAMSGHTRGGGGRFQGGSNGFGGDGDGFPRVSSVLMTCN